MGLFGFLSGLVGLFNKLFVWLNKRSIEQAARDRQVLEAKRDEERRVADAQAARDRALAEFDRLHPKPPGA